MRTLKGKLEFIDFWRPIRLITDDQEYDLRDFYFPFLETFNGLPATMDTRMNELSLYRDDKSEYVIDYKNEGETILMILRKAEGFGMSNISAYMDDQLQRLNGRVVIFTVAYDSLIIKEDPEEKVTDMYYTHNNSCAIPEGQEQTVCKIGTNDTCIFCTFSARGFECDKFNTPTARYLLNRFGKGEMNATRIGNCAIRGRKEIANS